jgi:two-component system NarL family sensor kinase
VQTLAQTLSERTGIAVDCAVDHPHRHPDDAMLYGVARELLSNVARHAKARSVRLRLDDDGEAATLDVQDDGVGMDPAVIARRVSEGHIGLASHRARIETLGGSVAFLPAERGTWVRVWLPLHSSGWDTTATPDPRNRANPVADTGAK